MRRFDTIVLGAGPAGTGPLVAAAKRGTMQSWLARGILWADASAHMGAGSLPHYAIDSDTMARVLLEATQGVSNPLGQLAQEPLARHIAELNDNALPLSTAAAFYHRLGAHLEACVSNATPSAFWAGRRATHVLRHDDGAFETFFDNGDSATGTRIVFAMGGHQDRDATVRTCIAPGVDFQGINPRRLMLTGELFSHGGRERVAASLRALGRAPRIVIVGGSHSALCAATQLLETIDVGRGGIRMLCRRIPKVFYPSVQAAHEDGYTAFDHDDICPATGRVFRLAGARMASRALLQRILGVGGRAREERVQLEALQNLSRVELEMALHDADLIIPAFGYRPNVLPITDVRGHTVTLSPGDGPTRPLVDSRCRILDVAGRPVANAYGIGLAAGYVPRGDVDGGEPSFRGQTNGLWLYQHTIGQQLLEQLHAA